MSKPTKRSFTLQEKYAIITEIEQGRSRADICAKLSLKRSTVWSIWQHREKIKNDWKLNDRMKKVRLSLHPQVDEMLFGWFQSQKADNLPVNGPMLRDKAEELGRAIGDEFTCSSGWLDRFKKRHNIGFGRFGKGSAHGVSQRMPEKHTTGLQPVLSRDSSEAVAMSGAKRRSLSLSEKVKILDLLSAKRSNADVCKRFGLPSSSVSTIWAQRDKILSASNVNAKRVRKPVRDDVDEVLLKWFRAQTSANVPITNAALQRKAYSVATALSADKKCGYSISWVDRFKKRHNIKAARVQGESNDVLVFVTDCKIRWKSLKDVYRKRKKEMSDGVTKRHCKWEHMDSLNFLEGVMSSKSTPATPKPKKNEPSDRPDLVSIQMLRDANEEEEEETEVEESEIKIEMDEMDVEEAALLSINKEESDREMNGAATHSTNSHVEEPDQESSAAARHPLQIFFDSMACTAMSFPPPLAVRAKTGVLEVISKLELEMWNQSE